MNEEIRKELTKIKKAAKKQEKERVLPIIQAIESMISGDTNLTIQTVCAMSELLKTIACETENNKVNKSVINILVILIQNLHSLKNSSLVPIKAQLNLDRTMVALDIFIANLINKIGG